MNSFKPSDRANLIKPSATIAVSDLARELRAAGRDVIGLGAGEPDFDTPQHIKDAAIVAMQQGQTKYTAVDGTPELKDAIVRKFQHENNLNYEPPEILVSTGAKQCISNAMAAILNDGDEVIIAAPYWVSYSDMVLLAGGVPVFVNAEISQGFKITPEQLRAAISDRTKLLMLNSPCNPTGVAYRKSELAALAEVLLELPQVLVLTDDIYEHLMWADEPFCNIVNACSDLKDRTIVINGVSKAFAMTGWRIGYSAAHKSVTAVMRKIQSQSTSNANSIAQAAAVAALNGPKNELHEMVKHFKDRHDYIVARLNALNGVNCLPGDGAFYALADFSEVINNLDGVETDTELSQYILNEAEVAVVPGTAFGAPGYLRFSFATGKDVLEAALDRLDRLFGS